MKRYSVTVMYRNRAMRSEKIVAKNSERAREEFLSKNPWLSSSILRVRRIWFF